MATDNNIGKDLADLLATHNFDVELSNAQNNSATADDATVFKFDYVTEQGRNYGTAVIVVGDDNDLMLFYGDNLGKGMEPEDKDQWFAFMKELKDFSIRHNFHNFSPKNLNNLKHTMQGMAAIKEGLFEGYYGTRRVSYMGEATDARLVIKHNKIIGENDKRYRYVESLFIETADQERFKLPFKNLAGGRAMLEHVRQGGRPYDIRGVHITETVNEMAVLSRFRRAQQGRVFEGVTQELVEQANAYYESLHSGLKHMATATGYNRYFESWSPADTGAQEALVEDLKTMFIEQTLDTRIEAALPTLAKIQSRGQQMKEADIFESWANRLMEGTWALPDTPEAQEKLNKLMSGELIVGPDATNATELLYDVVGDDQLYDILSDLAERSKGRANIWDDTDVINRMQELGIQLPEPSDAPGEEAVPTDADGTPPPTEVTPPPTDQQMMESTMLDESGETLNHILERFKNEVKRFATGEELDNDLYDALYDYYTQRGDMPYGTMKARTGDPFEWVAQRLDRELGGLGFRDLDETDNLATFVEGSCNATMEGEYCPEHGLAECGYMESMAETDDPINYNAAVTGSYYESDELTRIKSLALVTNEGWKGTLAGSAAGGIAGDMAGKAIGPSVGATLGGALGGPAGAIAGGLAGAAAGPAIGSAIGGLAGGKIGDKLGGQDVDEEDDPGEKLAGAGALGAAGALTGLAVGGVPGAVAGGTLGATLGNKLATNANDGGTPDETPKFVREINSPITNVAKNIGATAADIINAPADTIYSAGQQLYHGSDENPGRARGNEDTNEESDTAKVVKGAIKAATQGLSDISGAGKEVAKNMVYMENDPLARIKSLALLK